MAHQPTVPAPGLELQPMVHVRDMAASVAFFEQLGGEIIHGDRDSGWVLMQVGTTQIGLVASDPGEDRVELHFSTGLPLDELRARLRGADLARHPDLGPQVRVRSPDGLVVRISQRAPE